MEKRILNSQCDRKSEAMAVQSMRDEKKTAE